MIINQWVPAAHRGDAIGDSARRVRDLLRAKGHTSDLFALTIDDDLAVIGSSNMDFRSFALNYEVVVLAVGSTVVDRVVEVQDAYRAASTELTAEEWGSRSWRSRYVDNVMRLTATLQ